jgi:GTP-binding protein HflX|tara:strand:- start:2203 stop:3573 length:1371 start_codon:yes stop_codon:yes gene_type:complete
VSGDPVPDVPLLAGMGGMNSSQYQTAHAGRRAILLSRNDDTGEYESLASTLGIEIVDKIIQRGKPNPRSYLGSGKLQEIAEEMEMSGPGHLWHRVDLVLIHDNLKSSQLVNINDALTIETWDRVRLLLELFTRHASSAEARIQVRIARLLADRSILRELTNRETMGERLGYGAGGQTGWNNIMKAVGYEITRLRRRLSKLDASMSERRRQRSRSGALTVGLAGYTNVGKSSLFNALSGKAVLIRDQVFSTLETTVGRMENKPRILMVDTIGFIDNVPAELLDSFSATLQESLSCDMLLLLVDASNEPEEIRRKLATSSREVSGRIKADSSPNTIVVLTKIDLCTAEQLQEAKEIVHYYSPFEAIPVSTMSGGGIEELRSVILTQLHGPPVQVNIIHPEESSEIELAALVARVHRDALVIDIEVEKELTKIYGWIDIASQSRLTKEFPTQINITGKS